MELPASIPKERAVKIAERFHAQLFMTPARIIVKQRDDNPNEAVLLVTRSKLTDKYVDTLREEGYSIGTDERVVQCCLNCNHPVFGAESLHYWLLDIFVCKVVNHLVFGVLVKSFHYWLLDISVCKSVNHTVFGVLDKSFRYWWLDICVCVSQ